MNLYLFPSGRFPIFNIIISTLLCPAIKFIIAAQPARNWFGNGFKSGADIRVSTRWGPTSVAGGPGRVTDGAGVLVGNQLKREFIIIHLDPNQ